MLISTISNFLCAWFAFLLPCFSTFKALSHRPISEQQLERWSMYWTVMGVFLAFQYVAEWLVSWMPFYWEVKTLFILYLALPQTEGSTFIYRTYLQPFLTQKEADLDAGIVSIQGNVISFLQAQISNAWNMTLELSKKIPASGTSAPGAAPDATPTGTPPAVVAFPWQAAMGLWSQYGPSLMNALPAFTRPQSAPQAPSVPAAASSTSVQSNGATPPAQYRAPFTTHSVGDSGPSVPFPEPQHF